MAAAAFWVLMELDEHEKSPQELEEKDSSNCAAYATSVVYKVAQGVQQSNASREDMVTWSTLIAPPRQGRHTHTHKPTHSVAHSQCTPHFDKQKHTPTTAPD